MTQLGSYFKIKASMVLGFIAVFLVSMLFFSTNLQGSAGRIEDNPGVDKTDKSKQVAEPSKESKDSSELDTDDSGDEASRESQDYAPVYYGLDPLLEMRLMQERMDRFFNSTISRFHRRPGLVMLKDSSFPFSPKMDISENDTHYIVRMDLPGMNKADIKITFQGRNLVITGKREKETKDSKDDKAISYERSYGQFTRVYSLPGPFDKNKTKAKYKDGVLTITIVKIPQEPEKEITIEIEEDKEQDKEQDDK